METVPKSMYIQDEDAQGNAITVVSTTPDLRSTAEFAEAIYNHNQGKPTAGFLILPDASMQAKVQRGYQSVNEPLQAAAPIVGRAAGEYNPVALMFNLAAKAGVPGMQPVSEAVTSASGTVGETLGRLSAEQVNTLPKAGMTAATAIAAPAMLAAKPGAGVISGLGRLLTNTATAGLAGLTGAEGARRAGGQEADIPQRLQDFAVAATGGSAQTLIGHFLTRFMNRGMQEKVATQIVDSFKEKYSGIGLRDNVADIAISSRKKLTDLTQMMSKGIRDSIDEDTDVLLDAVKGVLPGTLPARESVAYQATLRAGIRKVRRLQDEQLNNVENPKLYQDAGQKVQEAITEVGDSVRGFIYQRSQPRPGQPKPPPMNMEASALRAEGVLQTFQQQAQRFNDGAQVLHYMKLAETDQGLDLNKFAQLIRGKYEADPGSRLQDIGRILGQGRDLTDMPLPKQPLPEDSFINKIGLLAKQIPGVERITSLMTGSGAQQTPWLPKQPPMQPLISFGAQEAGQAAIKSFLEREEK